MQNRLLLTLFTYFFLNISNIFAAQSPIFVVANIDSQVVTNLDLQNRYKFFIQTSNVKISSKSEKLFILNKLTEKLIEEKLQLKSAKDSNITLTKEEFGKALDSIAISQGAKNSKQVEQFFKNKGIPYDEYVQQIAVQLLYKELVKKNIAPKIKITQSDVTEMLELQKINTKKTSLNLSEIFIPFKNKEEEKASLSLANKLAQEINNKGDFVNIARQFSKSASKDFDGEIGWVEILKMDPKIYQALKDLKVDKISNPIRADNGYYIFKVMDKKIVEEFDEDDETKVRNLIFNEKLKVEAKSYLSNLKKEAYIRINQEKIALIQ